LARKGFGARVLRWLATAALALAAGSALPVLLLRWVDPWTSAFMLRARADAWRAGDETYRTRHEWVDLERISTHAAVAVIAAEDQQFPFHAGFDFESIREAVRANGRGKRTRGASTLTQQVAKNLFLWPGRSYLRKGLEAWFTLLIEVFWPKERILEVYLNVAEFGRGVYGVEAAARKFFRKPAKRLNRHESALLAAVLPNPRRFRVDRPSRYVVQRQQWILAQMRGLGGPAYLREIEREAATTVDR
jgi:monofunctional biosynthetic peptidoglycan transglycosylase